MFSDGMTRFLYDKIWRYMFEWSASPIPDHQDSKEQQADICQVDLRPETKNIITKIYRKLEASEPTLHSEISQTLSTNLLQALSYMLKIKEAIDAYKAKKIEEQKQAYSQSISNYMLDASRN